MMRKLRAGGFTAVVATIALLAAACDDGASSADATTEVVVEETETEDVVETVTGQTPNATVAAGACVTGEEVGISWWHNGDADPLRSFWQEIADEFMAEHPTVHIAVRAENNQNLRYNLLPAAFTDGSAPDIFQSWGGGELVELVNEGKVKDLTQSNAAAIAAIGGPVASWQVAGRTYGLPYTYGPSGFWFNKNLFEEAGLSTDPADLPQTLDELFDVWDTLRAHDITPVALGGRDLWPVAHWWYWTALRSVPLSEIQNATVNHDFSDPSWIVAGERLQEIFDEHPFNEDCEDTYWSVPGAANEGTLSSSGLVVNGDAAMELMGVWSPGVMLGIYNDLHGQAGTEPPNFIGWFPFPEIPDAEGDPSALLGGGDGFSLSADAPIEAACFLDYLVSSGVQTRLAQFGAIPTAPGAVNGLDYQPLVDAYRAAHNADHVILYLDVLFGPEIASAMNSSIEHVATGDGEPEDIVTAIKDAAR